MSPSAVPFAVRIERLSDTNDALATVQGLRNGEAFEITVEGPDGGGRPFPATADPTGVYRLRIPVGPSRLMRVIASRASGEGARAELVLAAAVTPSAAPTTTPAVLAPTTTPAAATPLAAATASPSGPLVTTTPAPTVRVRGTVRDRSGAGVAGILVEATVDIGQSYDVALSATTGADGTYELVGVPGSYSIVFNAARAAGLAKQYWRAASHAGGAVRLPVTADQSAIDATLDRTFALTGRLESLLGGFVNACVHAMALTDGPPSDLDAYRGLKVASARGGADGRFTLRGVPPGTYRVTFSQGFSRGGFDLTRQVSWWQGALVIGPRDAPFGFATSPPVTVSADLGGIDIRLPLDSASTGMELECDFY